MPRRPYASLAAHIALRVAGVLVVLYIAQAALGVLPRPLGGLIEDQGYDVALALAALACLLRGFTGARPRLPWLLLGTGATMWAAGDIYWDVAIQGGPVPAYSLADLGYLLFYPFAYAGLALLGRERMSERPVAAWLDGVIGGLAVASVAAAVVVRVVTRHLGGDTVANLVNVAYPLADALLLALVVATLGLTGWRPGRSWWLIASGLAVFAVADSAYFYTVATGAYKSGLQDSGWPVAMLLIGASAWQPAAPRRRFDSDGWRVLAVPVSFGMLALAVLVLDHFERSTVLAVALATAALLATLARMAITFFERGRLLARTRADSLTDALTGLGNRRLLTLDLENVVDSGRPFLLLLFDLDGFKPYNDAFGHPAGDGLLARLGRRLEETCHPLGRAYRMGGDEFCVLLEPGQHTPVEIQRRCERALTAQGDAFTVTASWGCVELPVEADRVDEALRLADRRMYAQKHAARPSPGRQSTDVLLRVLAERHPELGAHGRGVTDLARAVGEEVGLEDDALEQLVFAAELHDIGKVAVPDEILGKPGPLDAAEWAFMRRHTVIGQRIIEAAPALVRVARIVRASHERWDGTGYPDALRGESIPLQARIIAVCDAWDAMTSDRPYRRARTTGEALVQLREGAGTQFDPRVVDAFLLCRTRPGATSAAALPA